MKKNKPIFIFDLDNTIIKCDSLKIFLLEWFKKNPKIFFKNIIYLCFIYFTFIIKIISRDKLKLKFLSIIFKDFEPKYIHGFSEHFSKFLIKYYLRNKVKKILKKKNIIKILITASPDFYVEKLAKNLNFDTVFCTKINLKKNKIKIIGKNCFGIEKLRIIKKLGYDKKNLKFFTDSYLDFPLIKYCSESFVIPNNLIDKVLLRNYKKLNW